ncbi:MAG: ABC transporter permease [Phenylobacterium sp.]|uniref:ABC transporter permease n=1 Tax=Phenylobacterium sp. TaxID=1871053 RepID=UPI00273304A0|nr:ABC transporter permease [Phenylobacterium sp.]MDP3173633.1 ABC transporter permease [Phenylobacterium sp.]
MEVATHMLRTGRRGALFEISMALRDVRLSIERIGLAWSLAWHDVVSRYRGSILGPFWITLSMGLMVLGIGLLYAQLFKISLHEFMPFVAIGIVCFGVITGMINEGCETFVRAAGMLSQTSLPMFTFVWRTVLRNLMNLAHHAVIIVAVLVIYGYWRTMNLPLAAVGLVLLVVNAAWISALAGIASARFRDVPQIVMSIMQFAIFMTPVFWRPSAFPDRHALLTFNPFYHMLEAVRAPLMGAAAPAHSYAILCMMGLLGWLLTFAVFTLTRRRIVHYL